MRNHTQRMILTALFAGLTAIGAFLKIPLGLTSITLQFFFTAMAGVLLGPKWGAASQAVYVALGLAGLPIFTMGGGPTYLLQPSFGFLLGLIPAVWLTGTIAQGSGAAKRVIPACIAGDLILYAVGVPYMYLILNVYLGKGMPLSQVLWAGMAVYLPGDALKIAAVTLLARPLVPALSRLSPARRNA